MTKQELYILQRQPLPFDELDAFIALFGDFGGDRKKYIDAAIDIYNWGYMQGKRAERRKKKKDLPYRKFVAFMEENGIKAEDIADLLGKKIDYIKRVLNGTSGDFSMADVRKICLKYGISSDVIFAQAPKH